MTNGPLPRCAYCNEKWLLHGKISTCLGTGDYIKCPNCSRWQLLPIDLKCYLATKDLGDSRNKTVANYIMTGGKDEETTFSSVFNSLPDGWNWARECSGVRK